MLRPMSHRAWPLLTVLLPALALAQPAPAPPATPAPAPPPPSPPASAATIKPVPPKGIAVPEADRRVLEAELSTLAQELKRLRERPESAALLPDVEIFYRAVDSAFRYGEFFDAEDIANARKLLAV